MSSNLVGESRLGRARLSAWGTRLSCSERALEHVIVACNDCCCCLLMLQIFGPKENEPLDVAGAAAAFEALGAEVNAQEAAAGRPAKSADEVAMGFVAVANETMCRPIRALTQMKVRMHVRVLVLACLWS